MTPSLLNISTPRSRLSRRSGPPWRSPLDLPPKQGRTTPRHRPSRPWAGESHVTGAGACDWTGTRDRRRASTFPFGRFFPFVRRRELRVWPVAAAALEVCSVNLRRKRGLQPVLVRSTVHDGPASSPPQSTCIFRPPRRFPLRVVDVGGRGSRMLHTPCSDAYADDSSHQRRRHLRSLSRKTLGRPRRRVLLVRIFMVSRQRPENEWATWATVTARAFLFPRPPSSPASQCSPLPIPVSAPLHFSGTLRAAHTHARTQAGAPHSKCAHPPRACAQSPLYVHA